VGRPLGYPLRVSEPNGQPKSTKPKKFPWGKIIQSVIAIVVIVAIFGFWIPQFADYSDVWPLLKDLSASQWFWLAVAQFLNLATYWLVYVASLPGLTFWQACVSVQTNSSIASVLPAGGAFAIGITYQFLGSWGFTPGETTELIGVSGFWNFGCKLLMPVIAVLLLLASGEKSHTLVVAALIGLAVCIVAAIIIGLSLWKETIAKSLGRGADHAVSWVLRPFHRNTGDALERMLVDFRHQTIHVARTRWWFLTWSSISSQLAAFLVFTLSMRFVGVTSGQVNLVEMFAAFCFGMLVGSIPITPGGLGTADAVYIGVVAGAGASHEAAVAGDLLFRFFTYLLQIPIGAITYVVWKRKLSWRKPQPSAEPTAPRAAPA
jgi:putative heme transporter